MGTKVEGSCRPGLRSVALRLAPTTKLARGDRQGSSLLGDWVEAIVCSHSWREGCGQGLNGASRPWKSLEKLGVGEGMTHWPKGLVMIVWLLGKSKLR